ncbi:SDR family oxidoreductase [Homoserinibacter sp. YIM 151385]|uniref:SDR family oxidoreductase n=1 Tax=Homoserinibacter sp. YIM 151385 TaxID=2985506 RepID=UPI0022F0EF63|nr:SDR family oxidoreductase [Homoserinibacter sp. YIM 151385]WBU39285.1 SDR family oxidoreductase [Homoserinibacter sp. YIM 151385]
MGRPGALVIGVGRASSIGAGIAARLAREGWDLAFTHRTEHDLRLGGTAEDPERIAAELRQAGARVVHRDLDLADAQAAQSVVPWAAGELGPLTALVLTHAEGVDSDIASTSVESWDRHFAVNARASWLLVRDFAAQAPGLEAEGPRAGTGRGRIVALTSDHVAYNLPYGASKGALDRLIQGAAVELGDRGITANLVNPGPIDTGWMDDAIREWGLTRQRTGRLGTPADTASLVAWLLSPDAGWVTGQLITSDGGFSS